MKSRIFYGWWIVSACLVANLIGNAIGLFGAGVYLDQLVKIRGWQIGVVSGAATLFYVASACCLPLIGNSIAKSGPRAVIMLGAASLAAGVGWIGRAEARWEAYGAFLLMGVGWACLSTTAIATTLSPWFAKGQGRAVSIALLGASIGGIIGVPLLMSGIRFTGFKTTTDIAALVSVAILIPIAALVLIRRPQDIGLRPYGLGEGAAFSTAQEAGWKLKDALRTPALRSVIAGFGCAMMVQIGFLTHQVLVVGPHLGERQTAMAISATGVAALIGRLALTKFADRIDDRLMAGFVLVLAAAALCLIAAIPVAATIWGACILFGFSVGNVTTLSPIIVRREFGAESFGVVFGFASCAIQIAAGVGPAFYGLLRDFSGSYTCPLLLAAAIDLGAAAIVVRSRA
jgi:predicted MFS family arabinose efflux permease